MPSPCNEGGYGLPVLATALGIHEHAKDRVEEDGDPPRHLEALTEIVSRARTVLKCESHLTPHTQTMPSSNQLSTTLGHEGIRAIVYACTQGAIVGTRRVVHWLRQLLDRNQLVENSSLTAVR
jgi:threonine dehydrogenase-like Zn-dependent dehydrogenase